MATPELSRAIDIVSKIPEIQALPDLLELFPKYQSESGLLSQASYDMLVPPDQRIDIIQLHAASYCIFVSGFLFDNIMDHDLDKPESHLDEGRRANLAGALLVACYRLISESAFREPVKLRLIQEVNDLMLEAATAQDLEARLSENELSPATREKTYWKIIRGKSSQQLGHILKFGAILAEQPEWEEALFELGLVSGDMIQLVDDMGDALGRSPSADWDSPSKNLLILFCLDENNPRRDEFARSFERVREEPAAHQLCRKIIVESGALGFAVYHYYQRYLRAMKLIEGFGSLDTSRFKELLNRSAHPMSRLLRGIGIDLPAEITKALKL